MHSAKILAETEMNQHSGKILATIAFQIPVPANTNICNTTNIHRSSSMRKVYIDLGHKKCVRWREKKVDPEHKESFPLTYLSKKGNLTT